MKFFLAFFSILPLTAQATSQFLKPWERFSDPVIMSKDFVRTFSELPKEAIVTDKRKYWSSDYWPLNKGGINLRWNSTKPNGFDLVSPDKSSVFKMTLNELKQLSPSEKFDLYRGDYSYALKKEVAGRTSPRRKDWEGICHGWAAAALNHNEPQPKLVKNPDGIQIPFGSSDIKALLSYYYAYKYKPVSTHQMGRRCNGAQHCEEDMNAGAFHIVLANQLGLQGKGFIADIENGREVWNHVAYDYETQIIEDNLSPGFDSAPGTYKVVRVKTEINVVFNIIRNSWFPVVGTPLQTFKSNIYEYDLDLDEKGAIIGGKWISELRPDFLWTMAPVLRFQGNFQKLKFLLQ